METKNIHTKWCDCISSVKEIIKTEQMKGTGGNYKYFNLENIVTEEFRKKLEEHNLYFTFEYSEWKREIVKDRCTVSGLQDIYLNDCEGNIIRLVKNNPLEGTNNDFAKARGCAESYALKYILRNLLMLPATEEDANAEATVLVGNAKVTSSDYIDVINNIDKKIDTNIPNKVTTSVTPTKAPDVKVPEKVRTKDEILLDSKFLLDNEQVFTKAREMLSKKGQANLLEKWDSDDIIDPETNEKAYIKVNRFLSGIYDYFKKGGK